MIASLLNRLGMSAVIGAGHEISSRVMDHGVDLIVAKYPVLATLLGS